MLADANADEVLGLSVDAVPQIPARKDKPVPWDYNEDELLKACVLRHRTPRNQPAWPAISAELRSEGYTRTAQEARCRFSRIEKGRMRAERAATSGARGTLTATGRKGNLCHACGQPRMGHSCPMKGMNIASRTPQRAVATTPATTPATTQPQWAAAADTSPQWAAAVVVDDTSLGPVPPIAAAVVECVPPAQEVERPTLPESERRAPERQPSCPLSMYEELGVVRPSQPNTPLLTPTMLTPINTSVINHNVAEINLGAAVAAPAAAPGGVCGPASPLSPKLDPTISLDPFALPAPAPTYAKSQDLYDDGWEPQYFEKAPPKPALKRQGSGVAANEMR